jgi:HEPN domain-containing protein
MPSRYEDWLRQAQRDSSHAQNALEDGDYDWACLAAQQAAEKAVNALFRFVAADAWGHSVSLLLGRLPQPYRPSAAVVDGAKELDKHYIPSRYPNGFDEGAPLDYYTKDEAIRSISHARAIITFCEGHIRQPKTDPHSPEEIDPGMGPETPGA